MRSDIGKLFFVLIRESFATRPDEGGSALDTRFRFLKLSSESGEFDDEPGAFSNTAGFRPNSTAVRFDPPFRDR